MIKIKKLIMEALKLSRLEKQSLGLSQVILNLSNSIRIIEGLQVKQKRQENNKIVQDKLKEQNEKKNKELLDAYKKLKEKENES